MKFFSKLVLVFIFSLFILSALSLFSVEETGEKDTIHTRGHPALEMKEGDMK